MMVVLAAVLYVAPSLRAAEPPRLAVVIVVDQCRADYLDRFRPWFVADGFRRLLERGVVFTEARHRHALTATAPGHATIATGVHASVHGIIANEWFDATTGSRIPSVEDPAAPLVGAVAAATPLPAALGDTETSGSPHRLLATTIGDQLKLRHGAQARVIALSNKDRAAIFLGGRLADGAYWLRTGRVVTSRYYRETLPAWVEEYNATDPINRRFGATWDQLLDAAIYDAVQGPDQAAGEESRHGLGTTFPRRIDGGEATLGREFHNAYRLDPHGSAVLGQLAQRAIAAEQLGRDATPDLLCLGFSQLDYCGHSFGPDSHEIMDSVLRLDRALAELFQFLDREIGPEHFVAVLTADHGVAPLPERVQAFTRDVTAGRLDFATLTHDVEAALAAAFGAPPGVATWTIRDSYGFRLLPATLAAGGVDAPAARQVIKDALQRSPQVAFAWTREEVLGAVPASGPYLDAWRLSYHAGRSQDVVFSPRPYIVDRRPAGSNHGTPNDYDNHVPLLWYGAGLAPAVRREPVGTDAIAPTLAQLLGAPRPPEALAASLF